MDLAIPTLSLPSALPRPTQFGQTLGRIKVVLLSDPSQKPKSDATSEEIIEKVMQTLIWDNEDIVDAGEWEMIEAGSSGAFQLQSLHASTDWLQPKQSTTHSQPSFYSDDRSERFEGNENIEIVRVLSIPSSSSLGSLTARLKRLLVGPFHQLSSLLLPSLSLSIDNQDDDDTFDITSALARLLASSDSTPLFTALVVVVDPAGPSDLLKPLLRELSSLVPIVILPHAPSAQSSSRSRRSFSSAVPRAKLSAFSPNSLQSLLVGLFRAPETLKTLRMEAVERFLKWREVEGEVARSLAASSGIPLSSSNLNDSVSSETQHPLEIIQSSGGRRVGMGVRLNTGKPQPKWQEWKQQWETEWMESFSVDVASRLKEERGNEQTPTYSRPSFKVPGARKHLRLTERKDTDLHGREAGGDEDRPSSPSALIPTSPLAQSTTLPTDPLHLPSLIFLSLSLLGPLKQRLRERIKNVFAIFWDTSVPLPGAISTRESHSCKNCGFALPPVTRREHEIASRSINHGNRRLVLVGIGGLVIGVGIGLCAR
ncbi:hypothetical protein BJ165DRAFT_273552 [Panaeolus papilionaceus]|nr:hypothetical protein BJ165DRAFT_273552 [Panaeolus papilionaceus]